MRLTTRSIATAEAIRDRIPFTTSGALRGEAHTGGYVYAGHLNPEESALLNRDRDLIKYIVWSYSTPIAWFIGSGVGWHVVDQKFSITTTKHQGNLYLCKAGA